MIKFVMTATTSQGTGAALHALLRKDTSVSNTVLLTYVPRLCVAMEESSDQPKNAMISTTSTAMAVINSVNLKRDFTAKEESVEFTKQNVAMAS